MTIHLHHRRPRAEREVGVRTAAPRERRRLPISWPQVTLAGTTVDLFELDDAVDTIIEAAQGPATGVLGVVSINLDHLHHFGSGRASARVLRTSLTSSSLDHEVRWLGLLDGAPLVARAGELTGRPWPRLAGSDLIEPILVRAEREGLTVGFLGGSAETHAELARVLAARWPELRLQGCWAPARADLDDPERVAELNAEIRAAGVDILAVCLGKPRQEKWIAEHAGTAGVRVALAFGAVVDFLAGRVDRAPRVLADHGLEWAWRLANEPRRLARRYLVQGPPAYRALQRDSFALMRTSYAPPAVHQDPRGQDGAFVLDGPADVAVLVVTQEGSRDVEDLIAELRQPSHHRSRLIVIDDAEDPVPRGAVHPDVTYLTTGRRAGYAGAVNLGMRSVDEVEAVLVLRSHVVISAASVDAMLLRLAHPEVGVVAPAVLDRDGEVLRTLRREPSVVGSLAEAVLGGGRLSHLTEIEWNARRYRYPHEVDWAVGTALMFRREACEAIGSWDETYYRSSEETDALRRVREAGYRVWYEPRAEVQRWSQPPQPSDQAKALVAVNKVRYAENHHGRLAAGGVRVAVMLGSALRSARPEHRLALRYLGRRSRWSELSGSASQSSRDGS